MSETTYGIVETNADGVKVISSTYMGMPTDLPEGTETIALNNINSDIEYGNGGIGWWLNTEDNKWYPQSPRADFTWDSNKDKWIPPLDDHPTGDYELEDGSPGLYSYIAEADVGVGEWVWNGSGGEEPSP